MISVVGFSKEQGLVPIMGDTRYFARVIWIKFPVSPCPADKRLSSSQNSVSWLAGYAYSSVPEYDLSRV